MDDNVYVWPGGTFCNREKLSQTIEWMGDGYDVMTEQEFFEQYPEAEL